MAIEVTRYACEDPQRGPHNRCRHPEAPPAGTKRCKGDPACAFRLPTWYGPDLCPYHEGLAAIKLEYETTMTEVRG